MKKTRMEEMSTREIIIDTMVTPFLSPFMGLQVNTAYKLVATTVVSGGLYVSTAMDVVDTPVEYWIALFGLALLDWIAGTFRSLTSSDVSFDLKRWGRTAYKFVTYSIALIATSIAVNVMPFYLGWVQHIVVGLLIVIELFSVFRHIKLLAVLSAAVSIATSSNSRNLDFTALVERKDKKLREQRKDSFHKEVPDPPPFL